MRAGRLRHRLIVDRPDATQGDAGDERITWTEFTRMWAAIEPARPKELNNSGQIVAELGTLIVLRWSPKTDQITAKFRFRHEELRNPTIYNIAGPPVHVKLGQREIQFQCISGANQG